MGQSNSTPHPKRNPKRNPTPKPKPTPKPTTPTKVLPKPPVPVIYRPPASQIKPLDKPEEPRINAIDPHIFSSINTKIEFDTEGSLAVPLTHVSILKKARQSGSADKFMETYKLSSTNENIVGNFAYISSIFSKLMDPNSHIDTTQDLRGFDNFDNLQEYLQNMENSQLPVMELVANVLNEEMQLDTTALIKAKKRYEAAKASYEVVENRENQVSYYEGWFPITRPLKVATMYTLFGISILFAILSVLLFLNMGGVQLNVVIPTSEFSSTTSNYEDVKKYIFGGVAGGGIIAAVGIWRGWFR